MKGLAPLFLGIFGTFAFSWVGLTLIPNWQIGHLNPQSDEEGTDIYPMPQSGMVQRGARVYAANGCIYCHSEQVHAEYAGADIERKWGARRSGPCAATRSGGLQSAAFSRRLAITREFACNNSRSVTRFYGAERANEPCYGSSSTFKVSSSRSRCGRKSSRFTKSVGATVARANRGLATDLFRCLASCASLFAAKYQPRFEHALLSVSLPNSPYQ